MLHYVKSNQCSCSAKSSLAMDSDGTLGGLCLNEPLVNDIIWRYTSIDKVQIEMLDSIFNEPLSIVGIVLVQSHNQFYSHFLKYGDVVFWGKGTVLIGLVEWS